jgi:hypothetical protein
MVPGTLNYDSWKFLATLERFGFSIWGFHPISGGWLNPGFSVKNARHHELAQSEYEKLDEEPVLEPSKCEQPGRQGKALSYTGRQYSNQFVCTLPFR